MARIFPPEIETHTSSGRLNPELETLYLLKKTLPDAYTVFHSVHWARETARGTAIGEVDFVVLNKSGEALLIEQKTGELEETDKGLRKPYDDGNKSVANQVHRSLEYVKKKWGQLHGREQRLDVDYLLYCPDYRVIKINAAGLDASRIVDASRADRLASVIQGLLSEGNVKLKLDYERAENFFAQQFELMPDISTHIGHQEKVFTRLASDLYRVVDGLDFKPFRLRVIATAGSGKSHMGVLFYQQAKARAEKVLFVCYNNMLAHRMRASMGGDTNINTYHGWCRNFLESLGEKIDIAKAGVEPDFWKRVQERVLAANIPDADKFDCLIVDEGQDFEQDWWEILELFLKPGATVLWMEDPAQDLYNRDPVELPDFVTYRDPRNFRTPQTIASFIRDYLKVDFEAANPLPGLHVEQLELREGEDDPVKKIAYRLKELSRLGFSHDDIVILSCVGQGKSVLGDRVELGGVTLQRPTGKYNDDGSQQCTDGQVLFDTVRRFKGQQSPAVILIDAVPPKNATDIQRRVMFCGMTRATVKLEVVTALRSLA